MGNKLFLQSKGSKDFSGVVTKDSLTVLGQTGKVDLNKTVQMLYKANHLLGISDYLEQVGSTRTVPRSEDSFVVWKLQGSSMKTISLVSATDIIGSAFTAASKPGLGKQEFYMFFNEAYFTDVHMIAGEKGSKYQLRILDDPEDYGSEGFRYRVQLTGNIPGHFMPYEQLTSGKQFSIEAAPVESTMSKKGAGFNYTSPIDMKNTFGFQRFQETVPANMQNRALLWEMVGLDSKGNKSSFKFWDDYASFERRKQIKYYYEKMIYFSKLNVSDQGEVGDFGKSGNALRMGSGIQEQLENGGNYYPISDVSLDFIEEVVFDLSDNTKDLGQRRDLLIITGKYGARELRRQMSVKATAFTPLQSDKFISKGKNGGFVLDTQFSQYVTSDGSKLTVMVNSMFDDKADARTSVMMSQLVPGLPGPASSYTYQIMDVGVSGMGEKNVELVKVEGADEYSFGFKPGPRSAFGSKILKEANIYSSDVDADTYTYITPEVCVCIKDTSRTVTMKPSILD